MNKKYLLCFFTIACSFALTACSFDKIPEMTEEEQALVTEYAADLLLAHDKFRQSSVLTEDQMAEEERLLEEEAALQARIKAEKEARAEKEEEKESSEEADSSEGTQEAAAPSYTDIDEFLELSGVEINYAGYQVCDSYPADADLNDWQGVCRATGGNKLVVFSFDISNVSGSDYYLDMASLGTRFTYKINGRISKSVLTTLLTDDFLMYRGDIGADQTQKAVMIIELSPDDAASISSVTMKMKYNGVLAETTLE